MGAEMRYYKLKIGSTVNIDSTAIRPSQVTAVVDVTPAGSAMLTLSIFNMGQQVSYTGAEVVGKEVELIAGYGDDVGVIFRGIVARVERDTSARPDIATVFYAYQGDKVKRNLSFRAGSPAVDMVSRFTKRFNLDFVQPSFEVSTLPRSFSFDNTELEPMLKKINEIMPKGLSVFVSNGSAHIVTEDAGSVTKRVSIANGLIGSVNATINRVSYATLLDCNIRTTDTVQLDVGYVVHDNIGVSSFKRTEQSNVTEASIIKVLQYTHTFSYYGSQPCVTRVQGVIK